MIKTGCTTKKLTISPTSHSSITPSLLVSLSLLTCTDSHTFSLTLQRSSSGGSHLHDTYCAIERRRIWENFLAKVFDSGPPKFGPGRRRPPPASASIWLHSGANGVKRFWPNCQRSKLRLVFLLYLKLLDSEIPPPTYIALVPNDKSDVSSKKSSRGQWLWLSW